MADFPVNARFGDVCQFLKGRKPSKVLETKTDGAIPYLLIDSFTNPPSKFTHDLSLPRCTPNDILMVMDGASSGLVAMGVEGAIGSTLAAIKPNSKVPLVPKYLYYWLRHQYD